MAEVLLLEDRGAGPRHVVVHHVRTVDRIAARIHGLELDRRLAEGTPPEANATLTLRAERLLGRTERRRIAAGLRDLVRLAQRPLAVPVGVPIARQEVLDAAPAIQILADRLDGSEPVGVRGVALARLLLTDGTGPLYSGGRSRAVARAIDEALAAIPADCGAGDD
jgi:hypothetical protein